MSKHVFVLGAGASVKAGAPLMKGFLSRAEDLFLADAVDFDDEFRLVLRTRSLLQQVHSKSTLDIGNIEEVFALFELASMAGGLGDLVSPEDAKALPDAMRIVITETIERSIVYPTADHRLVPTTEYRAFAQYVKRLVKQDGPVTVITTNYDLCPDVAFWRTGVRFSYGIEDTRAEPDVYLLKLHGSLNWGFCTQCGQAQILEIGPLADDVWSEDGEDLPLRVLGRIRSARCPGCGGTALQGPRIVPPVGDKGNYCRDFAGVWQAAMRELSDTRWLTVIGYSLPPNDHFFQSLYRLGTLGPTIMRQFRIVDPSPDVPARFGALLGQQVTALLQHIPLQFDKFLEQLESSEGPGIWAF